MCRARVEPAGEAAAALAGQTETLPGKRLRSDTMSQVRFQVLFGLSPANRPGRAGPAAVIAADRNLGATPVWGTGAAGPVAAASGGHHNRYGWRLIGANNRELGRSALGFGSYHGARSAVVALQRSLGSFVQHLTTDPATGRRGWHVEVDGACVAVSGRWYERDHDARLGAAKFVALALRAAVVDGVVAVHERRGPGLVRVRAGGTAR